MEIFEVLILNKTIPDKLLGFRGDLSVQHFEDVVLPELVNNQSISTEYPLMFEKLSITKQNPLMLEFTMTVEKVDCSELGFLGGSLKYDQSGFLILIMSAKLSGDKNNSDIETFLRTCEQSIRALAIQKINRCFTV